MFGDFDVLPSQQKQKQTQQSTDSTFLILKRFSLNFKSRHIHDIRHQKFQK